MSGNCPVDVISLCSAEGKIQPLRLRVHDENHEMLRIDIAEVVSTKTISYVGVEAQIFLCRANVWGREWLFELKYQLRSHSWRIVRRLQ